MSECTTYARADHSCGKWVNNVGQGSRYDGTYSDYNGAPLGSCDYWNDYTQWNASTKADFKHFAGASMDAYQVSYGHPS